MSTRGTVYFEIQESLDLEPTKVAKLNIMRDAYPSGIGVDICMKLQNVGIKGNGQSGNFPCVERIILNILYDIVSDYISDDEYVYRFIFKTHLIEDPICRLEDITDVIVKHKYENDNFSGTFAEFMTFCAKEK